MNLSHHSLDQSGDAQNYHERKNYLSRLGNVVVKIPNPKEPDSATDGTAVFESVAGLVIGLVRRCADIAIAAPLDKQNVLLSKLVEVVYCESH